MLDYIREIFSNRDDDFYVFSYAGPEKLNEA